MKPHFCLVLSLIAAAALVPLSLRAQDQSDGTLHVVRPSINAEQDLAELCLEFDHALDLSDRNRVIAAIRLESGGKNSPVAGSNVTLTATSLCLQSLAHRQDYSLTLAELHGVHGEKMNEPYRLPFTVPDRRPSLAFAGDAGSGNFTRIRDNDPVLRAVNVARVTIMVYRLTDPAHMADANVQRMQTTLAPSESLAFARANGQLVWQTDLTLDDSKDKKLANQTIEQPVPIHAGLTSFPPGLYFMMAADAAPAKKSKAPVDSESDEDAGPASSDLGALAAHWFLRSDLKIRALHKNDGYTVEAKNVPATAVLKDVRTVLFSHDEKIMAEARTGVDGLATLPLAAEKNADASTIVGLSAAGDADFVDVAANDTVEPENRFTLPDLAAAIVSDRPFYTPDAEAHLLLIARNIHGEALAAPGSTLQLLRPDQSVYASMPVAEGKTGIFSASFPVPAAGGSWNAVWRQPDGRTLAETKLRVTPNETAPVFTLAADRAALNGDGDANILLKSLTSSGEAAPFIAGHVLVEWKEPDNFSGWNDYRFGTGDQSDKAPVTAIAFITDGNGTTRLHMTLRPPDDTAPLHIAMIRIHADPASGALDPESLALPVKPGNLIIGIRPFAPDGKFAENSLARFDVIAIDGDGKRRENAGLKYQIYEEGRSFAWYQSEGRWKYKLLQQRRRLGGGPLDVKANGPNPIRWPVTAGAYTLEITDTAGGILARYRFNAGWGLLKASHSQPADLALTPDAGAVQPGQPAKIKFTLDRPAVVSAVIADDRIRKIIFEARPAGDNEIVFTPDESWGDRIRIRVEGEKTGDADTVPLAGQIDLPVHHQPKELGIAVQMPDHGNGGQDFTFTVAIANIANRQPTFVNILATPEPDAAMSGAPRPLPSLSIEGAEPDAAGKVLAHFPLPQFSGQLHFRIFVSNQSQSGRQDIVIPVRNTFDADLGLPLFVGLDDMLRPTLSLKNNDAPPGAYHYALASPGLKIGVAEGKMNFAAALRKEIVLDIKPMEAGTTEIAFDLGGPHDFRLNRHWPLAVEDDSSFGNGTKTEIAPQHSWNLPLPDKAHARIKPEENWLFVSSQPVFDLPQILPIFTKTTPFTTAEMATWLETVKLWRDLIVKTGLEPADLLQTRRRAILERLLARQKNDGGFPSLPDGDGDLIATAAAVTALAHSDLPSTRPAIDAAAGWLQQHLANTWFGEDERPLRAAAFAALAAIDRLDVSALRYFADTSTGKNMPPLAMAQLAAALAKSNDQDKAVSWLKLLHDQIATTPAMLPVLADNPLADPRDLLPALEKLSDTLVHHPSHDPQTLSYFLRTLGALDNRAANWRIAINGSEKTETGILALALPAKAVPLIVRDPADRPIYLTVAEKIKALRADGAIARRFYRADGGAQSADQLAQGAVYLVVLEGSQSGENAQKLFVHDGSGNILRPLGCTLDGGAGTAENWGWLRDLALTTPVACEAYGQGVDAVLPPSGGDKRWRTAYFVKAPHNGSFNLVPPTARNAADGSFAAGAVQTVTIR